MLINARYVQELLIPDYLSLNQKPGCLLKLCDAIDSTSYHDIK